MTDLRWDAPGPGTWTLDGSHLPGAPTPIYGELHPLALAEGVGRVFARVGVPLGTIEERPVNGRLYSRMRPLVGADKAGPPPPAPLLWLVVRLHPEFRRRTKTAKAALAAKVWRKGVERWNGRLEGDVRRANLALQGEDLAALDDGDLAAHLQRSRDHTLQSLVLHFDLHGDDLGPLGDYVAHCRGWGIDPAEALAALEGSSPASNAAEPHLLRIRAALEEANVGAPATIDDVRAASPAAAAALDAYLEEFGWRLVTGYDLDARALQELPDALLRSITSSSPRPHADGAAAVAAVRARVPEGDRPTFDAVLGEARLVCDLRDRNGPMTVAWPTGLLRRALLEAGRRLHERGQLDDPEHAVELELGEVLGALRGSVELDPVAVKERAAERARLAAAPAPPVLGPQEAPPPLHLFPPALARVTRIAIEATGVLGTPERRDEALAGTGIGGQAYTGVARVAARPEDALALLEPGDVLVVPFTTPAYNTVLAVAGAVVCEDGGPLSHAAVMARELGIPAVVGAAGAMTHIADGATVTVDPASGRVHVLSAPFAPRSAPGAPSSG
jgi:pyruvate,water dikinase